LLVGLALTRVFQVPEAFHSADKILKRVGDAGLTPNDLVELLASHSIGVQERVDPVRRPFNLNLTEYPRVLEHPRHPLRSDSRRV
jgi:hypothetical protein